MRGRFSRGAVVLGLGLTLLCAFPASALAWANGPQYGQGFGTHDWVLYHANQSAKLAGYDWVDWPTAQAACDDPDMVLRDSYYHVYARTGIPYGDSPARVVELYRQAVGELQGGDRIAASRTLGMLSHYLSDTANPLHTDQTVVEKGMHSRYEDAVDDFTSSPSAGAGLLSPHTATPTGDPKALTVTLADKAHPDYDALVSGYSIAGNSPAVQEITARSLNAAVAGIADAIAGIGVDAGAPRGEAGERGAGSSLTDAGAEPLPFAVWCLVGMSIGLLLVGVSAVVIAVRRRV